MINSTKSNQKKPVIIGISGASGSIIAYVTIEKLLKLEWPVITTISPAARKVWQQEIDESYGEIIERWSDTGLFTQYAIGDLAAPISSGTFPIHGMAIVPCSMGTISAIATGLSDNLLRRSADVSIKENRTLIVVPRETPLSAIHLENMTTIAKLGTIVIPPHPAFYLKHQTVEEIVDFISERILLSLNITDRLPSNYHYGKEQD